ncbi:hypothetical protein [Pedobacter nanyangensis]|uniref:hypothetical protein n=1 Tax=Pedobacter nanyangensis TaxID=1562389 RepID=UPI0013B42617|nr:hypothetical protein [Pedobacter nanyangensis]
MKIFRIVFLFFAMLLALPKANAQYQGFIVGFEVVGSSHLMVNQQASSTTFKVSISVNRTLNGSTFYPFRMNFKLGIENGELFPTVYTITDADFTAGQIRTSKEFSATIANTKLPDGRKLQAYYNNPSNNNPNYSNSNLLVTIFNPPPVVEVPQISNNTIALQYNPVVGSEVNITGSSPSGGNGSYTYEWQIDYSSSGNYFAIGSEAIKTLAMLKFQYGVGNGSTIRRKIMSGGKTSYSSGILLSRDYSTPSFSVSKTPVLDVNGNIVGNKFKVINNSNNPNVVFSALMMGPDGADPWMQELDANNEVFLPLNYFDINYPDPRNIGVVFNGTLGSYTAYATWWNTVHSDTRTYKY